METNRQWAELIEECVPGLMPQNEVEFLMQCVQLVPPNTQCVDLGTYLGKSAAAICIAGNVGGLETITIDKFRYRGRLGPSSPEIARKNLAQLGLYPTIINASSSGKLPAAINKIGFLFIDTRHTANQLNAELKIWLPHLVSSGIIALHDYHDHKRYTSYVAAIDKHFKGKWELIGLQGCIIGFRKP